MRHHIVMRSLLLLCLALMHQSWAVLDAPLAHAEAGQIGYGPPSPLFVSSYETYGTETSSLHTRTATSLFDLQRFWMRADLRVRPEWRNGVCFGGGPPIAGACNSLNAAGSGTSAFSGNKANDSFIQQWARVGLGYDPSPDVNFYIELQDSATWGASGSPTNALQGGDASNHQCAVLRPGQCRLGLRAAYGLLRNLGGIDGLSLKLGRQYLVFGNQRLFGHFDWANTGYSHDGIMLSYATSAFDTKLGWFRHSETDLGQADPGGSLTPNLLTCTPDPSTSLCNPALAQHATDAGSDVDMVVFYNQIRSLPRMVVEPYYVLYSNRLPERANPGQYLAKSSSQLRHMVGLRIEVRHGNWDMLHETAYQFGQMADGFGVDNRRNLRINAWASGTSLGHTWYQHAWKPRVAIGFDYASGDGDSNCATPGGTLARSCGGNANTFENFFPTNFLHVGYMLNGAWRNSVQPQINFQARPTARDHIEIWALRKYLASARDNWYRGSQGPLIFSRSDNTTTHIGDELDVAWSHMFADGKISLAVMYGHFFSGPYIREHLGTTKDQDWGIVQLWTNF
ncbi:MAG: alginate export family protein [Nitrospira sp.]|uniref:Alginate_exp domain-containing protein n=2 Tax=Nitrospira defluvii TaxID=330214 RepID=A0ABN7MAV5_9BACT|nr:alginate export family protein [Nitrospira sp.]CAE6789353.1 Alginate_exp domain-containing protein [Nitrospira defluvii]